MQVLFLLDTTIFDQVCQSIVEGLWLPPGTLVSSPNKTDSHDIQLNVVTEIVESGIKDQKTPHKMK